MENILGYYLMPHPPVIIPDIGMGREKEIDATTNACNKIGAEIASLKPETIIVITPHSVMFSDAISISDEDRISGDLRDYRCSNIKMDIEIDREFNKKLDINSHLEGIPTILVDKKFLSKYNYEFQLDHGTMIPLYFINKYYNDYKLVHINYAPLGDMVLYRFGIEIEKVSSELGRKIVIIASGDLSHKLTYEGPYSYSPYGEKFDKELLSSLKEGDIKSIFTMNPTMINEAAQCGMNSVDILLGAMNGYRFKGELLSYEGPFGVGYGVMKFNKGNEKYNTIGEITKIKEEKLQKKIDNSNIYTKLARESLNFYFANGYKMTYINENSEELLKERHGVFVSLKKFGQLRGCIGTIAPTTNSVAEEIIRNAIESAIEDPRFPAVREDELKDIDISIDILMEPKYANKDELDPKKYGVIVTKGTKRGLLLPNLEGVDTVEYQLNIACSKAGIDIDDEYNIEKFEVIRFEEGE